MIPRTTIPLVALFLLACQQPPTRETLHSQLPERPYSGVVRAGHTYYFAGRVGVSDSTRALTEDRTAAEVRNIMESYRALFDELGLEFGDVVQGNVFLADVTDYAEMNAVYGEYFPNPAIFGTDAEAFRQVSHLTAMLAEAVGTAFLACFVFALTEPRNPEAPRFMVPLFIGLAVSIIISIVAPLTQAALNPARDFGPRLVAYLFGWGSIAIPGPRGGFFTVYVLAPIVGGLFGAGIYQAVVRRYLPRAMGDELTEVGRPEEVSASV